MWRALSALCVLVMLAVGGHAALFRHGAGGSGGGGPCNFTGSVAGSCLPSSDTTDSIAGPRALSPGITDHITFDGSGLVNYVGQQINTCQGYFGNAAGLQFTSCAVASAVHVCQTPGDPATASQPWLTEDVVAWQGNPVSYQSQGTGPWTSGIPSFSPVFTYSNNSTFAGLGLGTPHLSLMASLAACNPTPVDTSAYFVNSRLGPMLNLADALRTMGTGDTVTVSPSPAGIPYWPSGNNYLGPTVITPNPPYDITLIATGALFGYAGALDKGTFEINNDGTTIDGGTCFWNNGGLNEECIPWVSGLDLTVKNFRGELGPMGAGRASFRTGIGNFQNVTLESFGCNNAGCNYGNNHNMYFNESDAKGGFDKLFLDNQYNPDVTNDGWNLKLRSNATQITNSFFGGRINSGLSFTHGPIDFPCGGYHTISNTVLEANPWSLNYYASGQPSSFLVLANEEYPQFCGIRLPLPSFNSAGFSATIIDQNTFSTTTNPVSFVPMNLQGGVTAFVWDKGVSGRMQNIDGDNFPQVTGWSGPDGGGNYTVTLQCFAFEGTIPLRYNGQQILSCFTPPNSGTITLYAFGGPLQQGTQSSLTSSFIAAVDPRTTGIEVGSLLYTNFTGNPQTVASITGTGPYTINTTCVNPGHFIPGGPCEVIPEPNAVVNLNPIASGTYNSSTGAVSLTIGTDAGYTTGSTFTVQGITGTGSGAGNVSSLNGTWTATAGTGGTTLNFTGPTGLGTITITTSGNSGVGNGDLMPASINYPLKGGPNLVIASTTGSGCDGTNTLCGITVDPRVALVEQGMQVTGTNVAAGYGCVTAGQVAFINPIKGSSGTGYTVGDTITLAGGTGPTAAVVQVATTGGGGAVTSVTITNGGVFTDFITAQADHKTWTQASTSGSGTGAQFEFPLPAPIVGGSGPYTLRLAQAGGANCITGSSTNQTYSIERGTNVVFNNDIFGWDGPCTFGPCTLFDDTRTNAWNRASISNSLIWTNTSAGEGGPIGPTWSSASTGNVLFYGPTVTDGGGNVICNNRKDLATSARCAIPPFTTATFTGSVASGTTMDATGATRGTLTVGCAAGSSCMSITSGTYNSSTGIVTLTVSASGKIPYTGGRDGLYQSLFEVSGLTGTGTLTSLNGVKQATTGTTGTTLTYQADPGLGSITITGGSINAAANASACAPGMFVWDNNGAHATAGAQGVIWGGWTIVSGSSPFTILIPPGGNTSNDIPAGTVISCGWGTPSSAFNGTVNSSGVLTINSGLVGSVHVGDFLADIFSALPANVRITSGSGTSWQTTYSGGGVAAEYMVSVRSQIP